MLLFSSSQQNSPMSINEGKFVQSKWAFFSSFFSRCIALYTHTLVSWDDVKTAVKFNILIPHFQLHVRVHLWLDPRSLNEKLVNWQKLGGKPKMQFTQFIKRMGIHTQSGSERKINDASKTTKSQRRALASFASQFFVALIVIDCWRNSKYVLKIASMLLFRKSHYWTIQQNKHNHKMPQHFTFAFIHKCIRTMCTRTHIHYTLRHTYPFDMAWSFHWRLV